MLLVFSALGFGFALAIFVYLFDNYMGSSDTAHLSDTLSSINEPDSMPAPVRPKRLGAAGNRG
jgi:hypothetical protein